MKDSSFVTAPEGMTTSSSMKHTFDPFSASSSAILPTLNALFGSCRWS
jgi:hypothetical protein